MRISFSSPTAALRFFVLLSVPSWASYTSADIDYSTEIAPILEQYCVSCHGSKKQKSGYRLDSYAAFLSPGDSDENPINPRDPMGSPLMEYLLLPKSDDYAMPPEDEDSPSGDDILKIAHWIYQGAKEGDAELARLPIEELLSPEEFAAVEDLRSRGAIIHKRGQDEATLFVDIQSLVTTLSSNDISNLEKIATHTIELNLANLSSSNIDWLKSFTELRSLNLRNSQIPDDAIETLNTLNKLQTLNLFGTNLNNKGLETLLVPLAGKLYVGQTRASQFGIESAKSRNPNRAVYGIPKLEEVKAITDNARSSSNSFNPIPADG
ncbi:c-type cytochrome domain-containing protein [Pelagicoccus mobilis]|uniref:Cytochrome C Planctomycete-type domain-containing protein n=1 Tax=Pelagicoccus mobilis TaxID=415221 RepID=A0A934VPU0_9BACT|nr:c-type cytochrome domain-containing protein [Pelagicoccus mobilis]MBK1877627.1 hypothetical protein [Pelagicoccus mobilis]